MEKELELEAEKYIEKVWGGYKDDVFKHNDIITDQTLSEISKKDFTAGATSKWVEKKKLEFAIEQLNKLDSILQAKYEVLSNMQQEYLGKMKETQLANKKSGLRLAKEEIRRDIKELEQKLSEL